MEQLLEIVEAWLKTKGGTLWADWSLERADRRRLAAEWFASQLVDFANYAGSHQVGVDPPPFVGEPDCS